MPDQGLAPWVSANDKPTANVGAKPVTGDAAERRLKAEVMLLPSRDRRRIKDLVHNEYDPSEAMASMFLDHHKGRSARPSEVPASANGLNKMSEFRQPLPLCEVLLKRVDLDLEIRKRYAQPLAIESGEFPDIGSIESRMLPTCYEVGLVNGHAQDAAQFMTIATETFIKEFLSVVFRRTRSNGPGDSGNAGFAAGSAWIQTHKYRRRLRREESALAKGEISRDKSGLLPIEAKSASERRPLDIADLRLALDIGDCHLSSFPAVTKSIVYNYREGELEHWNDYTYIDGHKSTIFQDIGVGGIDSHPEPMDIDSEDHGGWEGAENTDMQTLDAVLDSCLVGV
ncbi:hypothetical protein DL770_007286 [Monosporascus sp. CRB-9-2]|nr:hypothetical protein DL770_007286 [Monosporascus sp. CRB-9-2]